MRATQRLIDRSTEHVSHLHGVTQMTGVNRLPVVLPHSVSAGDRKQVVKARWGSEMANTIYERDSPKPGTALCGARPYTGRQLSGMDSSSSL